VAFGIGSELRHPEQAADRIERRCHVEVQVCVHATSDRARDI